MQNPHQDLTLGEVEDLQDFVVELGSESNDCKLLRWPQGLTKEDQKNAKLKEHVLRAQTKVIADMATTTMKKAKILEDQVVFQLFIMPEKLITTPKSHEYLLLQRCEELERLQHQMGTLHTSHNATIVDTSNIATAPSALHPHVESTNPSMHHSQ
jgi:hypothetical protein